ncbi:hypothetical protein [Bradyrhizobium sp. URHC0002]
MAQNASKNKSKYQLDLLDEKRAFVVVALTDKLSLPGKLVALNALAHYNSKRGYSWPSIPIVAEESGYSPASTKSISPGFNEIEKVGAFNVVRNPASKGSKKSSTYRCRPIMPWFRDEYERLRQIGKIEEDADPFADIRSDNDNDMRQGSQPGQGERQGSQPRHKGSTTRSDGVINPVTQGYKPEEENRTNRTDRNEQTQADFSAPRWEGPVHGDVDGGGDEARAGQDAQGRRVAGWPNDWMDTFWEACPKQEGRPATYRLLDKIRKKGQVSFDDILGGMKAYARTVKGKEDQFIKKPANFIREEMWNDAASFKPHKPAKPKMMRNMAI